ncbi:uncharacterized protein LOC103476161 [Poecilia reticulata]|uniref:uncharacterized protein LOC103476161 n=1 Tax=Poecilia reticulata TaxID=8081 RepID=UPI0007E9C690|nr:PREDICTED: uncharacterized protein LOC103476161 [Poecilia reticulata]
MRKLTDPVILTAGPTTIPVGGSVALSCSVENSARWEYKWFRWTPNTFPVQIKNDGKQNKIINVTQGGFYQCKVVRETDNQKSYLSNRTTIKISFSNKVVVTRRPNWPQMFSGETITLTCEVQGGETTEWTYEWRRSGTTVKLGNDKDLNVTVSESSSGEYSCQCRLRDDWYSVTKWSEKIPVSVTVSSEGSSSSHVLLIVGLISGVLLIILLLSLWRYRRSNDLFCFRLSSSQSSAVSHGVDQTEGHVYSSLLHGTTSVYETLRPRGATGNERCHHHPEEDSVYVNMRPGHKSSACANLTIDPNWSTFYAGESVTFVCDMNEGKDSDWEYEIRRNGEQFLQSDQHKSYTLQPIQTDHSGEYHCCGVKKSSTDTKCSGTVSLNVTAQPKATLNAGPTTIPVGGSVTLICSVEPSAGWKYRWFRKTKNTHEVQLTDEENRDINVTQGGIYRCMGMRGNANFHSLISDEVDIAITFSNEVVVTRRPNWPQIFSGETITLTCEVQGGETTEWTCEWRRGVKTVARRNDKDWPVSVSESSSGEYMCQCRRRDDWYSVTKWSEKIPVSVSVSNKVVVTRRPNWPHIFSGETITLTCEVQRGETTEWTYEWKRNETTVQSENDKDLTLSVSESSSGEYRCQCRLRDDWHSVTKWSEKIPLLVSVSTPGSSSSPVLMIVGPVSGILLVLLLVLLWYYRQSKGDDHIYESVNFSEPSGNVVDKPTDVTYSLIELKNFGKESTPNKPAEGAVYYCLEPGMEDAPLFSSRSLIQKPNCLSATSRGGHLDLKAQRSSYRKAEALIISCAVSHAVRMQRHLLWMGFLFFSMLSYGHPEGTTKLAADKTILPAGGSVTLTCTVDGSGHFVIYWYRHDSESSEGQIMKNYAADKVIKLSKGGLYSCRGGKEGKGGSVSYTNYSNKVTIEETLSFKVTVTFDHKWPRIYGGETVTIRCEIKGGGQINWTYEWRKNKTHEKTVSSGEYRISGAKQSDSGEYSCRGRRDRFSSTEWSDAFSLTVYNLVPVLSVSPSWLNPGASVTLSCEVEHPPAGTRFFWYKAVPDPSSSSYSYELLPGSINGTKENIYISRGQTRTAGYVCEAGRGEQAVKSKPKFVWSAGQFFPRLSLQSNEEFHPGSSLKVNPDRVQHFSSDSVSFHCEGNSTDWRLMRVSETGQPSFLNSSNWGRKQSVIRNWSDGGIFWCESGLGEFSNAVNITLQNDSSAPLLLSPVLPVTEGDPVTLSCRDKKQNLLSNVFFYHNDKLIHNDNRGELKISAVSKSDEGFYKCQHSGKYSPRSWMSVRVFLANLPAPVRSSSNVLVIIGLFSGILLIILLLFLCYYIRSKAPDETREVTYAQIEVNNIGKKRRPPNTEEGAVYSKVKRGAADLNPVYADINHQNKAKKKRKGELSPPASDVIYSEIKSVPILDNSATRQDVGCAE